MIKAADGDTLRVAAGRYYGTGNEVAVVFRDVTLSGGWNAGFTAQAGASVLDGQQARRGMTVKSTAAAIVQRFVMENGRSDDGSGLRNYGNLVLEESAVRDNGAAGTDTGSGGILNWAGSLTLRNSAVTGNQGGEAGGIFSAATLHVDNCTISGNRGGWGGSAINVCAGTVAISSSTIADNVAEDFGAIHTLMVPPGSVSLHNTILAGNTVDCTGALSSAGYNLIGSTYGCTYTPNTGDQIGVDPKLATLADNGGPTMTVALLPGSPAIDAGNPRGASAPMVACSRAISAARPARRTATPTGLPAATSARTKSAA